MSTRSIPSHSVNKPLTFGGLSTEHSGLSPAGTGPNRRSPLLLALDSTGHPSHWLTWQDAIAHDVLGKVSYAFGDYDFTFTGGINRSSGERSSVRLRSILVLHGKSPSAYRNRAIALTNWALFRRDRFVCAYCGSVTRHLTRDHIVPVSRGGDDSWTNCCSACTSCNTRKGSHLLEELGWQLLYVPYVPNHFESLILLNRHILVDQMDFLLQMVPKTSRIAARLPLTDV